MVNARHGVVSGCIVLADCCVHRRVHAGGHAGAGCSGASLLPLGTGAPGFHSLCARYVLVGPAAGSGVTTAEHAQLLHVAFCFHRLSLCPVQLPAPCLLGQAPLPPHRLTRRLAGSRGDLRLLTPGHLQTAGAQAVLSVSSRADNKAGASPPLLVGAGDGARCGSPRSTGSRWGRPGRARVCIRAALQFTPPQKSVASMTVPLPPRCSFALVVLTLRLRAAALSPLISPQAVAPF